MNKKEKDDLDKFVKEYRNGPIFKYLKQLSNSKGSLKVRNYFLDLIPKEYFQEEIKKFRKKYEIPEKGFSESEKHTFGPDMPGLPVRWKYADEKYGKEFWFPFLEEAGMLCEKFKIPPNNGSLASEYIMYNKLTSTTSGEGLCMIQDSFDLGKYKETDRENNDGFPVLIRISAYASLRDILDYVKIVYSHQIMPIQEKYKDKKIKLGKIKSKRESVRERNNFIFENRNLPLKKIRKLLAVKKIFLDDGYIGKIISLEAKKRKEV